MRKVNVRKAKANLLNELKAIPFIIAKNGKPYAIVQPYEKPILVKEENPKMFVSTPLPEKKSLSVGERIRDWFLEKK